MEIKILKEINDGFLREVKAGWNYAAKKNFKSLKMMAFCAVLFLGIGFLEMPGKKSFWSFATCMGISYVLLLLYTGYGLYSGRQRWFATAKHYIAKRSKAGQFSEYVINDDMITIRQSEYYSEFKWTIFTDYTIYQDFLFIFLNPLDTSNVGVLLTQLSEKDKTDLLALVASKLPLRQSASLF